LIKKDMARKRRTRRSGIDELLELPWQAQLILAGMAAIAALVIPRVVGNPVLKPLMQMLSPLFWFAAVVLAAVSAISYVRTPKTAFIASGENRTEPTLPIQEHQPHTRSALDATWGEMRSGSLPARQKHSKWSMALLREMEWKRFEVVCGAYYAKRGFRVETIRCGPDGGIDGKLFFKDIPNPVAIIQCKSWSKRPVGVKDVRELLGVMVHNKVAKGIFHALGDFTGDAIKFAKENPIQLVTGQDFLSRIGEIPEAAQNELLHAATEGDYTTPTCPSCGIKLIKRESIRGGFWGCRNYPRCRSKIYAAARD
jgi:restriction system protein